MYTFRLLSQGQSSSVKADSPFDAAQKIAAVLGLPAEQIGYLGDKIYTFGNVKVHISLD